MTETGDVIQFRPAGPRKRQAVVKSEVFATLIFIFTEVMFFSGLVSAHTITRGYWPVWPPPGQPRLPVEATAFNTAVLVASGILMAVAPRRANPLPAYTAAMLCGAFFLVAQGREWVEMLSVGLTMTSSNHGAFFYLIVGTHGLHVLGGLAALVWLWSPLRRGELKPESFQAARLFWYFVVGLWPVLYWRVYL